MENWTFITKHYSARTCEAILNWTKINTTSATKCDILNIPLKKPSVVMVTSNMDDILKFKDYLKTITLV